MPKTDRLSLYYRDPGIAVLFAAVLLYALAWTRFYVGHFGDDARDILAAQSLLQGGYRNLQMPGAPPLTLPLPGFPIALVPFVAFFKTQLGFLRIVPCAFTLGSLLILRKLFAPYLSKGWLALYLALVAFNPASVAFSTQIISDSCYLFFLLGGFLGLRQLWRKETVSGGWQLGAVYLAAALIRPEGILLTVSTAAVLVYYRRWSLLFRSALPALAGLGFFCVRNIVLSGQASGYQVIWADVFRFWATGSSTFLQHASALSQAFFSELLLAVDYDLLSSVRVLLLLVTVCAVTGVVFSGIQECLAKDNDETPWWAVLILYVYAHLLLHVVWTAADAHYLWPLLPFVIFFGLVKAQSVVKRSILSSYAATGVVAVLCLSYLHQDVFAVRSAWLPGFEERFPRETLEWIGQKSPERAFFLSPQASLVTLYTGRHAMTILGAKNAPDFHQKLLTAGITHIMIMPERFLYVRSTPEHDPHLFWANVRRTVERHPEAFRPIFQSPSDSTIIYQTLPGSFLTLAPTASDSVK